MFFAVNIDNRAWIDCWVTIFRRYHYDIFNAEVCFKREFRVEGISQMLVSGHTI